MKHGEGDMMRWQSQKQGHNHLAIHFQVQLCLWKLSTLIPRSVLSISRQNTTPMTAANLAGFMIQLIPQYLMSSKKGMDIECLSGLRPPKMGTRHACTRWILHPSGQFSTHIPPNLGASGDLSTSLPHVALQLRPFTPGNKVKPSTYNRHQTAPWTVVTPTTGGTIKRTCSPPPSLAAVAEPIECPTCHNPAPKDWRYSHLSHQRVCRACAIYEKCNGRQRPHELEARKVLRGLQQA